MLISLSGTATELGITTKRLSRILKTLSVPVGQVGGSIVLDREAINRVKRAIAHREVRPGRRKKED